MTTFALILMVFAFVCLALAAFNVPNPPRVALGWLGLAFWSLAIILGNLGGFHITH